MTDTDDTKPAKFHVQADNVTIGIQGGDNHTIIAMGQGAQGHNHTHIHKARGDDQPDTQPGKGRHRK